MSTVTDECSFCFSKDIRARSMFTHSGTTREPGSGIWFLCSAHLSLIKILLDREQNSVIGRAAKHELNRVAVSYIGVSR